MALAGNSRFRLALDRVQWRRGLRAGIAVAALMFLFRAWHLPVGWASLGVLQVLMVDNGGPYRSRLTNIATILVGQTVAVLLGTVCNQPLWVAIPVTAVFCFGVTLARVVAQPIASSAVTILVSYIVAFGGSTHSLHGAVQNALYALVGGIWGAAFAMVLWPVDPFAPARESVADVFETLTEMARSLPGLDPQQDRNALNELVPRLRLRIEAAQTALAATPARMTARTVRARNLAAMVQAADLLFARILRVAELGVHGEHGLTEELAEWLAAALEPVAPALRERPHDRGESFAADGSLSNDVHRSARRFERRTDVAGELPAQFAAAERDCLLALEVAYESLRAIWTGAEPRSGRASQLRAAFVSAPPMVFAPQQWMDALRANLTARSVMFRHALRLATVVTLDVVILHLVKLNHGYWLPMTSLIVLQPYTGETWQRSADRVFGTLCGAVLAAVLAASVPSDTGLYVVISIGVFATLATYAVDYAWYCFFLTPTIVLLTLPHLRDWHFAAVRMGMTFLGAAVSVVAMLVFWPQRETVQLPGLLARAAAADAAYLRAVLRYWQAASGARVMAERTILAPARRACGLANNDAEESLDRSLLEHAVPLRATAEHERLNHDALTFTTYLRRLTQSITTMAVLGSPQIAGALEALAVRLDVLASKLADSDGVSAAPGAAANVPEPGTLVGQMLTRMDRQVGILETTAVDMVIRP